MKMYVTSIGKIQTFVTYFTAVRNLLMIYLD